MPASLTSSTVAPAAISSTRPGTRVASFWSNRLTTLAGELDAEGLRQAADPSGVLGGDDVGAAQRGHQPGGCVRRLAQRRGRRSAVGRWSCRTAYDLAGVTAPVDESVARGRAVPVISPAPLVPVADFGPVDRLQGWAMTAVITALAAVTRFLNLGSPTDAGTPIFDEKHYAPQAWQVLHNHGVEDNPGYGLVVHPPVGKQLIAIGEALFGYNGLGWRFSGAVCGVILVALVVRIARRMSRSTLVGGIAGLLLIADGVSFVASRTALLDGFLTMFVVAAFGCSDRRPRPGARAAARRAARGPHRRNPVGPAAGCALVALRCRRAARIGLCHKVVRAVLRGVLRRDDAGVRRGRAPAVPGAAAVGRGFPPRSGAVLVCPWVDPVRRLPGVLRALVRLRDRCQPARGGPVDRRGQHPAVAGRGALAVALHVCGLPIPRRADQRRRQPPSVGVQAVDLADVAAAGAVCDRQPERARLRCAVVCEGGDARRHAGDVVHRGAGARLGGVADIRPARLAIRRDPRRATARASCRGSPISTGRCTSSTRPRWRRSWCWRSR